MKTPRLGWGLSPGLQCLRTLVTTVAIFFVLTLLSPLALAQPARLGDLDSDGIPTAIDLVRLIGHIGQTNPLANSLLPYADINEDGAIDFKDVRLLQDAILGRASLPSPYSAPIVSASTLATNGSVITITGTARPNRYILITGGRYAVFGRADSNGVFTAQVNLRPNQVNALYVMATNGTFTAGTPQPLRVLQDSQRPNLFIDFPTNGATLYTESTVVAGRVGDSLSGFAGLKVDVRAVQAQLEFPAVVDVGIGNNGTFERGNVPLSLGTNTISVTATDIHGNPTNREIQIIRAPLSGPRLEVVTGDGQKTNVHRRLAEPLTVRVMEADGNTPLANRRLTFTVTRSDGRLRPAPPSVAANPSRLTNDINATVHGLPSLEILTDATGQARVFWAMGGDAGCGNNRVCVMGAGISNAVYFCASADPAPPKQINIGTGNNQKAETGGFLPEPLRAWLNDSCNGNAGVPITFRVIQGGGKLLAQPPVPTQNEVSGSPSVTTLSARTGHAEVYLQLGPDAGQNIVEANYEGNPNLPATFIAYGVARDPAKATSLSGLVLDNTSCPIGGASCNVSVGGQLFVSTTDVQGRFAFRTLPAGPAQLRVDGAAATALLGALIPTNSFPALEYQLILVPNAENSLPSPVLLPHLNLANQRLYYGTNDLVLTCDGMEGLRMTIKAESMRKPDGTLVGPDNPAYVSLNQVHHDNVPMPIPDGASPPFAWTLQPGGSTFDPPVQVEYPNMSGLPAGTIAYFLSFNHDTRRFEIICSGQVREDSATIVTDPGAGLTLAGWGCNCPPYSVTGQARNKCHAAIAMISGGIPLFTGNQSSMNELEDPGEAVRALFADIHSHFPNKAFTRYIPSANFASDQISLAKDWFDRLGKTLNPPFKVLIGYSAGGGSVHAAVSDATVNTDLAITIDPVDRAKAIWDYGSSLGLDCGNFCYQRPCEAASAVDLNILASDVPAALVEDCMTRSQPLPCGDCLRGFRMEPPTVEIVIEGTQHAGSQSVFAHPRTVSLIREHLDLLLGPASSAGGFTAAANANLPDYLEPGFSVSLNGIQVGVEGDGSYFLPNVSAPDLFGSGGPGATPDFLSDDYVRVIATSSAGSTNRYAYSEFFQIRQGETTFINDFTFSDIPPRKPESLVIACTNRILRVGEPRALDVLARFADGTSMAVPSWTNGTSYRVSNPSIASVSNEGTVIPLKPGFFYVTAVNEGASAVCGLNVVDAMDGLTQVTGFVVDTNGNPIAGAVIQTYDIATTPVTTDAAGRFTLTDIPTTLGPVSVSLRAGSGGGLLTAFISILPISGGVTDVGVLILRPLSVSGSPRLAVGDSHVIAIQGNGTLWSWGSNDKGQLGIGTTFSTNLPQPIETNGIWNAVATGPLHSIALREDGSMWAWGDNLYGAVGNGTNRNAPFPQRIGTGIVWKAIAAGNSFSVALDSAGKLWAWGNNEQGQYGNGTTLRTNIPLRVQADATWTAVAAGYSHTLGLRDDGTLWAWGYNFYGQLGTGTGVSTNTPQAVGGNVRWKAIAARGYHSIGLREDGSIWEWGDGVRLPRAVETNMTWKSITVGGGHYLALRSDETLWSWGDNTRGQLGTGTFRSTNAPTLVQANTHWTSMAAGPESSFALRDDGTLWSWGSTNSIPYLANGSVAQASRPTLAVTNSVWKSVTAGSDFSLAIDGSNQLWAWGYNRFGMLGDGTERTTNAPQSVAPGTTWRAVAAGGSHAAAVRDDGTLWTWGWNNYGQLGNGTNNLFDLRNAPQPILTNWTWKIVSVGSSYTVAIRDDGTMWSWGDNNSGQLGEGSYISTNTPQLVQGGFLWKAVAAGGSHTVALRDDDTLWVWGSSFYGQLGLGALVTRTNTPQPILPELRWSAIAAGESHTLALRQDGVLWAWGINNGGQLGNNSLVSSNLPQPVQTNVAWSAISGSRLYDSAAFREDGSLWTWGRNEYGLLGLGTSGGTVSSPRRVLAPSTWRHIAIGGGHSLGIQSDGTLWTWGNNASGQLGKPVPWFPNPVVVGNNAWGPTGP